MAEYIVCPEGYSRMIEDEIKEQAEQIVEIKLPLPLMPQLMKIPQDKNIRVLAPMSWEDSERNDFLTQCYNMWIALGVTRNTHDAYFMTWVSNAMQSYQDLMNSDLISDLDFPGKTKAFVVGNGPSLKESIEKLQQLDLTEYAVIACWHTIPKLIKAGISVDLVCHTDHEAPPFDWEELPIPKETRFVYTPKADPAFIRLGKEHKRFVYLDSGNPIAGVLATHKNTTMQRPVHATVVSLQLLCAIYAGIKEIYLIGVDNGWTDEDRNYPDANVIQTVINSHGVKMRTFTVFDLNASGIGSLAEAFPDVRIYQTTKKALDIRHVDYRAL